MGHLSAVRNLERSLHRCRGLFDESRNPCRSGEKGTAMIAALRQYLASRRLQRIVDERRRSFECQDYAKRREAALRGLGRA